MNNALKKINARVKVLQKEHPNSKRKTLQKQAGKEWRDGKLKKGVGAKKRVAKKKPVKGKRSAAKPRIVHHTRTIVKVVKAKRRKYKAKKSNVRAYKATRYKRVSGIGKMSSLVPIVAIAALGLGAYYLFTRATTPVLAPTTNPYRAQAQTSILQWASLAGLTAAAIASIINQLNSSDDDTVIAAAAAPSQYFNPLGTGI